MDIESFFFNFTLIVNQALFRGWVRVKTKESFDTERDLDKL